MLTHRFWSLFFNHRRRLPNCRAGSGQYTQGERLPILISELTRVEFCSSIAKTRRIGKISPAQAQGCIELFEGTFCVSPVNPVRLAHYRLAQRWLVQMTSSLRTLDALHLVVSHTNHAILITADRQLAAAAGKFGVDYHWEPYP